MNEQNPIQRLTDELEHDLTARYGVMLGSNALWRELAFRSRRWLFALRCREG
jgi:hypothetical protein